MLSMDEICPNPDSMKVIRIFCFMSYLSRRKEYLPQMENLFFPLLRTIVRRSTGRPTSSGRTSSVSFAVVPFSMTRSMRDPLFLNLTSSSPVASLIEHLNSLNAVKSGETVIRLAPFLTSIPPKTCISSETTAV